MITLPRKIYLTAMGKHWKISYIHTPGKLELIELPGRELAIYGKHYSKRSAIKMLIRWLKMKSQSHLNGLLIKFNRKIKVKYKGLRIHSLKKEWGSCSKTKVVSFNFILIFLPPALVKHLIIHELCHIRHLDHSPAFWREVAKYDKSWKKNQKALYDADQYIPEWLMY